MWAIENAVSQLPVRCRVVGTDFKLQPTHRVPVTLQRNSRVFNFLESSAPAPEVIPVPLEPKRVVLYGDDEEHTDVEIF